MSKNRVFGRPVPDASVPRNGFDLSKRINMQLPFGAIVPCYAHQAIAGSQFRLKVDSFFRTAAVNTAAFPRLKMETEFFCVPLRYLWSYWDNFKLGIKDYNSTALLDGTNQAVQSVTSVPTFDTFSALWPLIQSYVATDPCGYNWSHGAWRLADMLGYGRYNPLFANNYGSLTQAQNLFKIAAYQKVYFDHFRNTAYESNDPFCYNLDQLTAPDVPNPSVSDVLKKMFTLRYVNYRKDYFTSVFPGLNFILSTGSVNGVINSIVPSWIQGLGNSFSTYHTVVGSNSSSGGISYISQAIDTANYSNISVQSIRALFAIDKLTRSSAYAPQHVKAQYEARYGIKFPATSSFESQRIGSFDTDIVIGEVTSTANTESSGTGDALGAIGGKGVGSSRPNQGMISFDVKEDSIILGVCYAIPRQMYDSYRFDNWNMKINRNDFFFPEYMNLGLKPIYAKEFSYLTGGSTPALDITSHLNSVLAYQLPYMEYKADVDENHGLFADQSSDLGQFTVHTNSRSHISDIFYPGLNYSFFKVKPSDMDSIFVNAYDGTESTDHLFGELTFTIPVNQNMSVHGVPSL